MTPTEFKARYIESLPEVPEELREELDLERFVSFRRDRVDEIGMAAQDAAILADIGLPADASPYLNFGLDQERQLEPVDGYPAMLAIGTNGSGDYICIDTSRRFEVVYLNHDYGMSRMFINSSVSLLAESLCLFSLHLHRNDPDGFVVAIAGLDAPAAMDGAFWRTESESITIINR